MNTKVLKTLIVLAVLVGGVLLARGFFVEKIGKTQAIPSAIKMKVFQGKNPPYNFTFEYPETWPVSERGYQGDYAMVEVTSASEKEALVRPGMFITKKVLHDGDAVEGMMKGWLREESRYKNFKVSSTQKITLAGQKALKAKYSYTLSLPPWAGNAQDVLIKKEQIIFIRGDASFQVSSIGTEEQFKTYKPVFDHSVETFKFLD